MKVTSFLVCALVMLLSVAASARTWHIMPDGTGDAPTIQAGVDSAVTGDTVLVACGTYYDCTHPTPDGYLACVIMKSGVTLLGEMGEAGCATIDAQRLGRGIDCEGVDADASVEGLTITGGFLDLGSGGGMRCNDAALSLANLEFISNEAHKGGGLRVVGPSAPVVEDCIFTGNVAPGGSGGAHIYGDGEQVEFLRCKFVGNRFGALLSDGRDATLTECTLAANRSIAVTLCDYYSLPTSPPSYCSITTCVFDDNTGSAIEAQGNVYAVVLNCTLYRNGGPDAMFVYDNADYLEPGFYVVSSIVTESDGWPLDCMNSFNVDVYCSNFYGNSGGDWVGPLAPLNGIHGNFSACPSFCDARGGDFHLCDDSPCAPGNHPNGDECGLIGAWGVGCSCGPSQTLPTTWGAIKSLYR